MTRVSPSLLLHPLDFIGCDDVGDLAFFPGMDMLAEEKMQIVAEVIDILMKHYDLVTVGEHIDRAGPPFRTIEIRTQDDGAQNPEK